MRRRLFVLGLVTALATLLVPGVAQAGKPLDVDCDLLFLINDTTDDFLDNVVGVQVTDNLGGVASIHDFSEVNALFQFVAVVLLGVEPISFDSAGQFVSTAAKCGLVKPIIDNLRDFPD